MGFSVLVFGVGFFGFGSGFVGGRFSVLVLALALAFP